MSLAMKTEGEAFWRSSIAKDGPIEVIVASNGKFLRNGHHRFVAAHLADLPIPQWAIKETNFKGQEWPQPYEWKNIDWQ